MHSNESGDRSLVTHGFLSINPAIDGTVSKLSFRESFEHVISVFKYRFYNVFL